MPASASSIYEVRGTGDDTNGGGYLTNTVTITAATNATPIVITTAGSTYRTGMVITISGGTGNTAVNGTWTTTFVSGTTCSLNGSVGNGTYTASSAVVAGIDYSLQNGNFVNIDNSAIIVTTVTGAANTLTFSSGYVPSPADVGNFVQITAGTNTANGWYQINSVTTTAWLVTGTASLNNGGGTAVGITGKMGGALASLGMVSAAMSVTGQSAYFKYDASNPILVTVITNSVTGGTATASNKRSWIGYDTTRTVLNTDANRPTIRTSAGLAAHTVITATGNAGTVIRNLIIDAETNWATSSVTTGTSADNTTTVHNCKFLSCVAGTSAGIVSACESNGGTRAGTTGFASIAACVASVAHGCVNGFNTNAGKVVGCLSYSNTQGFTSAGGSSANLFANCTAANNSGDGFANPGTSAVALGCVSDSNGGLGFNNTMIAISCLANKNTGGDYGASVTKLLNCQTGSGSVTALTNTGSLDFSLNTTAGLGALGRAALAAVNALPGGIGAGYADIGAIQHQDTGGGAAGMLFIPGLDGL